MLSIGAAACAGSGSGDPATHRSGRGDAGALPAEGRGDGGSESEADGSPGEDAERCDGLDDDRDGNVDEGCACEFGATQECYPAGPVPGCRPGTQQCVGDELNGSWGPCEGAIVPEPGEGTCCRAIGDMPEHTVFEHFRAAYPLEAMPQDHDTLLSFRPETMGYRMTEVETNVGDEFIDPSRGGVTIENLVQGRDVTRDAALARVGVAAGDVLDRLEPEPAFDGGDSGCSRWGAAWGSVLYRTDTGSVEEMVYLYAGVCTDSGDAEAFHNSEFPTEVCPEGSIMLD